MSSSKLTIPEATVDPAADANGVQLYSKDVSGTKQFFARASDGTITQLSPVASADPTIVTPAALTGTVNNYAPAGIANRTILRIDSTVPATITGIAAIAGAILTIINISTNKLRLDRKSVV